MNDAEREKFIAYLQKRADVYREYLHEPPGTFPEYELEEFRTKLMELLDAVIDLKNGIGVQP